MIQRGQVYQRYPVCLVIPVFRLYLVFQKTQWVPLNQGFPENQQYQDCLVSPLFQIVRQYQVFRLFPRDLLIRPDQENLQCLGNLLFQEVLVFPESRRTQVIPLALDFQLCREFQVNRHVRYYRSDQLGLENLDYQAFQTYQAIRWIPDCRSYQENLEDQMSQVFQEYPQFHHVPLHQSTQLDRLGLEIRVFPTDPQHLFVQQHLATQYFLEYRRAPANQGFQLFLVYLIFQLHPGNQVYQANLNFHRVQGYQEHLEIPLVQ